MQIMRLSPGNMSKIIQIRSYIFPEKSRSWRGNRCTSSLRKTWVSDTAFFFVSHKLQIFPPQKTMGGCNSIIPELKNTIVTNSTKHHHFYYAWLLALQIILTSHWWQNYKITSEKSSVYFWLRQTTRDSFRFSWSVRRPPVTVPNERSQDRRLL